MAKTQNTIYVGDPTIRVSLQDCAAAAGVSPTVFLRELLSTHGAAFARRLKIAQEAGEEAAEAARRAALASGGGTRA